MSRDISEQKKHIIRSTTNGIRELIERLCGIEERKHVYEVKKSIWIEYFEKIKTELDGEALLVFLGPYSSGKSSFINALLGSTDSKKNILPTNDGPCTAVVTEIRFKKDGDHSAVIYKKDGSQEDKDFNDVLKIINGPTGASGDAAQYHHIELILDVEELKKTNDIDFSIYVDKIRFIDCPGYGSPYYSNEEVILEYVQNANFTFWMSPIDKFGGTIARHHLSNIKKNTSNLIPIITKSDLQTDEFEREKITEQYTEELGDLFRTDDPVFISSNSYIEARRIQKNLELKKEKINILTDEQKEYFKNEEEKIRKLERLSGFEKIRGCMFDKASSNTINEAKVKSAVYDLNELLKAIRKAAIEEETRWKSELLKIGVNVDSPTDEYQEIDNLRNNINIWIKKEVSYIAETLNAKISTEIFSLVDSKKDINNAILLKTVEDVVSEMQTSKELEWKKYFENNYKKYIKGKTFFDIEKENFGIDKELGIKPFDELKETLSGVLDAARYAGGQSVISTAAGAGLLVSNAAIASIPVVGSAIAWVASISGAAFILVGILPLIPAIRDSIKKRGEKYRKDIENKIANYVATSLKDKIENSFYLSLSKLNDVFYNEALKQLKSEGVNLNTNYKICLEVKNDINHKLEELRQFEV